MTKIVISIAQVEIDGETRKATGEDEFWVLCDGDLEKTRDALLEAGFKRHSTVLNAINAALDQESG